MEFKSNDFLKMVYSGLEKQNNQSNFVIRFFVAAGNTKYHEPEPGCPVKSATQGGPKHYITDRSLSDMKNSFPHPIRIKEAAKYLEKYIDKNKERALMDSFGFPSTVEPNTRALAYALAQQFNSFVVEDNELLENDVFIIFRRYLDMTPDEIEDTLSSHAMLYNGDDAYIASYNRHDETVSCCQRFEHTWIIDNTGRSTWSNRKLVNVNQERKGPRANTTQVEIGTTLPGKAAKVTVSFDARGIEGEFESRWQMQNEDGSDCFNTIPNLFNFKIIVRYNADYQNGYPPDHSKKRLIKP